jgi:alpha-glucosidase (family GH31 glycosyl hydrolase)
MYKTDGQKSPSDVRLFFRSSADEHFCGFGERYNAVDQRGNELDIIVYEQYKNQGMRTYLPVPFFVSSKNYAFRICDSVISKFDLCKNHPEIWSVETELNDHAQFRFEVWTHPSPLQNISSYLQSTALPKQPPDWIFGPWMSSNEWNSQEEVMKQADLTRQLDIPCSVLVIEAWSDESTFYIWNGAQYTPKPGQDSFKYSDFTFPADGLWPDPKGMIDELHQRGIRVILWQIPVLKKQDLSHAQHKNDQAYMLDKGFHLKYTDGSPYKVRSIWFNDSLLLDVSNSLALDWWLQKRAYLLDDLGVDGFKTDGGEHLWEKDVVFNNGMRGHEGMNQYPDLYIGAYHRFANDHRNGDAITFSRAGFSQAPAFPCHWAGDENSTWEGYRASLRAGINAGLCGVIFWAWDIAGFSKQLPSAELYLRAAAMATFCPIMQYHSEYHNHDIPSHDRTPWNIAEQSENPAVVNIYRSFSQLRMRLIPYIKEEARWCSSHGEPLMRALFLDWPADAQTWTIEDQYLFGRDLLVAPIIEENSLSRWVYLPAGNWTNIWTNETVSGPCWLDVQADLNQIPVFQKGHKDNPLLNLIFD